MRLELFTDDVPATVRLYVKVLGFADMADAATDSNSLYRPLRRGAERIAIQSVAALEPGHPLAGPGRRGLGVEIVLEVEDIQAVYDAVKARHPDVSPLVRQPWGLTDFRVVDPNGYYLRLTGTRREQ